MVLPNLIHPTTIEIVQIDRVTTFYDPYSREPIQQANRKSTVTCPGQLRIRSSTEIEQEFPEGNRERQRGYVLFRYIDLAARSITLQLNDKFTKAGHIDLNVYIDRIEPIANYTDQNGPSLLRAWFVDRMPSKQVP